MVCLFSVFASHDTDPSNSPVGVLARMPLMVVMEHVAKMEMAKMAHVDLAMDVFCWR